MTTLEPHSAGHGPLPGPLPGFREVVFLSHVNDPAVTPGFPGDPWFVITPVRTVGADGFALNYVRQGEHTGTHFDAPSHFNQGERSADQLGAEDFVRPAVVVDVRREASAAADYEIGVADLRRHERQHGRIPAGAAVLGLTGWSARWGTPAYANTDGAGNVRQPGFGLDAAAWLLAERRPGALGTDTFSPEASTDTEFRVSRLVLRGHRIVLANLTNLDRMPAAGGWIVVGGPRNAAGTGAPCTVLGLIPA